MTEQNKKYEPNGTKEQVIQIIENQIYLAEIAENEYSSDKLNKVLTYLNGL